MSTSRLDVALVQRGLAATRTKAQRHVTAGQVLVAGSVATKPALLVAEDTPIGLVGGEGESDWADVGRGATKLRAALDRWPVLVADAVCVDIGASTGGFTQVLLERGARRVVALDVGHNQLDPTLLRDERVINLEGVHAAQLSRAWWVRESLPSSVSVVVVDVSFISLTKIIASLVDTFGVHSHYLVLVKPQFEVGRGGIDQGLVKDVARREAAVGEVLSCLGHYGVNPRDMMVSPITGEKGNVEYLVYASATSSVHPAEWDGAIPAR